MVSLWGFNEMRPRAPRAGRAVSERPVALLICSGYRRLPDRCLERLLQLRREFYKPCVYMGPSKVMVYHLPVVLSGKRPPNYLE